MISPLRLVTFDSPPALYPSSVFTYNETLIVLHNIMYDKFDVSNFIVPGQFVREYAGATHDGKDHTLSLFVKKYIPREQAETSAEAITFFAAGGNGFPKVR